MIRNPRGLGAIYAPDPLDRQHPLARGLVSRWVSLPHLAGGSRLWDLAGTNHATLSGGYSWARGRLGLVPNYNGTNAVATVSNASAFNLTGDCTFAGWINPTATSGFPGVVSKFTHWTLQFNASARVLRFFSGSTVLDDTTAISLSTWTHFAITLSGGTLRYYINGVLSSSGARTLGSTNSLSVTIGSYVDNSGPLFYFPGRIDGLDIYRRALSAIEVAAHYWDSRAGYPETIRRLSGRLTLLMSSNFLPGWLAHTPVLGSGVY